MKTNIYYAETKCKCYLSVGTQFVAVASCRWQKQQWLTYNRYGCLSLQYIQNILQHIHVHFYIKNYKKYVKVGKLTHGLLRQPAVGCRNSIGSPIMGKSVSLLQCNNSIKQTYPYIFSLLQLREIICVSWQVDIWFVAVASCSWQKQQWKVQPAVSGGNHDGSPKICSVLSTFYLQYIFHSWYYVTMLV